MTELQKNKLKKHIQARVGPPYHSPRPDELVTKVFDKLAEHDPQDQQSKNKLKYSYDDSD